MVRQIFRLGANRAVCLKESRWSWEKERISLRGAGEGVPYLTRSSRKLNSRSNVCEQSPRGIRWLKVNVVDALERAGAAAMNYARINEREGWRKRGVPSIGVTENLLRLIDGSSVGCARWILDLDKIRNKSAANAAIATRIES